MSDKTGAGLGEGLKELVARIKWLHCLSGADLPHLPHPGVCLATACDRCSLLRIVAALEADAAARLPAAPTQSCDASHVETEGDAAWQASNKSSPSVQDKASELARMLNDARIGDGEFIDIARATPLLAAALATPSRQGAGGK